MKNIVRIIALSLILLTACKKNFLDIVPTSTVSIDILFKTDNDFKNAVVGCYNALADEYENNFWFFSDLRGDDTQAGITSNTPPYQFDVDGFYIDNAADILGSTWANFYKLITRANLILSKTDAANVSVVVNKERYIAEAKFLRALAYFHLVRIFGDVPMINTPLSVEDSKKTERAKVDIIYDEIIIPDLLAAESGLSIKYTGSDVGRATKGAVKALLGKVYLTRHDFTKAEAKLQEVTTMGYSLLPKFTDLFDYTKDKHHSEYIFDIEFISGVNDGSNFTTTFMPAIQGAGAALCAELARQYGVTGTNGGSCGCPSQGLFDAFDPKDKRKDITCAKGLYGKDSVFIPISNTGQFSFTKKYMAITTINSDSPANWKVIRYADVLLMYAEALNENGKTTVALTNLNLVRTRAGLAGYSGLTQSDARDKILTERRFELYLEGHRWFDLVRTGRALSVMATYGMKDYMTVFPIPLSQILLINNPTIFPQNPGYE